MQRATAGQLEAALLGGIDGDARRRRSGSRPPSTEPSSISFFQANDLSSVDDVDLTAGKLALVFALLGAEGSFGVKGSADRLLPDLLSAGGLRRALGRVPAGDRAGARRWCPAGARGLRDAGLVRDELPRRRCSPSRSGRCWRRSALVALAPLAFLNDRADLDLLEPELRRWLPYLLGIAFLGFLDDALGQGEAAATPARLARALRGRCAKGGSRPGRSRRSGRWRWPPTWSPGGACESWRYLADVALLVLATNLFNLLDLRPGRAEKALALLGAGLCLGAWTLAPIELLGIFAGPVLVGAWLTLRRAGDARRHRLEPDRGDRRGLAADRARRRRAPDRPRRWSLALTDLRRVAIYFGDDRSVPPLRWLDSLGRA